MNVIIFGIFLLGVIGIVLQVVLSIQKNKIWGLIIPCFDLLTILAFSVLIVFMANTGSIILIYGILLTVLFIIHIIIYGIARIVRKSMNTTEIKRQTQVEDVKTLEQSIILKEEMKKMEINDL